MASRFRDKMTYANVASTAALVLVVAGGGAATAAALIPNNSVNSAKIVNNSVKSIDIKNDNLTGTDINESSLGQVPSANSANSATNANNAATADVADAVVFGSINDNSFAPGAVGVVKGYAWIDNGATTLNTVVTVSNVYTFNSAGGGVTVNRQATGVYTVNFPTLDIFPGSVQVTPYGAGVNFCKVQGWGSSNANVLCFDAAGAATNTPFTVAMIE